MSCHTYHSVHSRFRSRCNNTGEKEEKQSRIPYNCFRRANAELAVGALGLDDAENGSLSEVLYLG